MNDLDRIFLPAERALDFTLASSRAIAKNLANVNTPNYKRVAVDFDQMLKAAQETDKVKRLQLLDAVRPKERVDTDTPAGPNGNNVSMEQELALLQRQALVHELATQVASGKLQGLRLAIAGRI